MEDDVWSNGMVDMIENDEERNGEKRTNRTGVKSSGSGGKRRERERERQRERTEDELDERRGMCRGRRNNRKKWLGERRKESNEKSKCSCD